MTSPSSSYFLESSMWSRGHQSHEPLTQTSVLTCVLVVCRDPNLWTVKCKVCFLSLTHTDTHTH